VTPALTSAIIKPYLQTNYEVARLPKLGGSTADEKLQKIAENVLLNIALKAHRFRDEAFKEFEKSNNTSYTFIDTFSLDNEGGKLVEIALRNLCPGYDVYCHLSNWENGSARHLLGESFANASKTPTNKFNVCIAKKALNAPETTQLQRQHTKPPASKIRDNLWKEVWEGKGDGQIQFTLKDGRVLKLHQKILASTAPCIENFIHGTQLDLPPQIAELSPASYEFVFSYLYHSTQNFSAMHITTDSVIDTFVECTLFGAVLTIPALIRHTIHMLSNLSTINKDTTIRTLLALNKHLPQKAYDPYRDLYIECVLTGLNRFADEGSSNLIASLLEIIEIDDLPPRGSASNY